MVDVVNEQVEGRDPLLESGLDVVPLPGFDDPGNEVEGKDLLCPLLITVNGEGDPHPQQGPVDGLPTLLQFSRRQRIDPVDQEVGPGPGPAAFIEEFIEERLGIVVLEGVGR